MLSVTKEPRLFKLTLTAATMLRCLFPIGSSKTGTWTEPHHAEHGFQNVELVCLTKPWMRLPDCRIKLHWQRGSGTQLWAGMFVWTVELYWIWYEGASMLDQSKARRGKKRFMTEQREILIIDIDERISKQMMKLTDCWWNNWMNIRQGLGCTEQSQ